MKSLYLTTFLNLCVLSGTACQLHCSGQWDVEGMEEGDPGDMTCYIVSQNRATWYEAKLECERQDGHLVDIESKEKYLQVKEVAGNNDFDTGEDFMIWIGANDVLRERHFVWKNISQPVTYDKWCEGPPTADNNNENCLALIKNRAKKCHWKYDDRQCEEANRYICEKKPVSS